MKKTKRHRRIINKADVMATRLIEKSTSDSRTQIPGWLLLLTAFVTGACILIIELVGARVLAPFFGSGIVT